MFFEQFHAFESNNESLKKFLDFYRLEYALQLASMKLNRSLSAVRQHYYYHKNKIDKKSLQKEFKSLVKSGKMLTVLSLNLLSF